MSNDNRRLLTLNEFCNYLNIGKTTAYRMLRNQEVECLKISNAWRIPKDAAAKYVSDRIQRAKEINNYGN